MTNEFCSLRLTFEDGLARVVLNRPELGNPFDAQLCADWLALANTLASRADLRAILLSAEGRYFSVGGDIRMFAEHLEELPARIREWTASLHTGLARLARLDAPIIAAVGAPAVGGAVALVAACDLVFASAQASFGAAYTHIGYSCDAGASRALATRMGLARARRFLLCGETLDASAAAECGLVDVLVDEDPQRAALAMAQRIARGPTRAFGQIRRLFATVWQQSLESQLEDEAQSLAAIAGTRDAREGIQAFSEKRRPLFQGR